MKTGKLIHFTDDECVILASHASKFLSYSAAKKEKIKTLPQEQQKRMLDLGEQLEGAYKVFQENANKMFNETDGEKAMMFGLISISIREFGDLRKEKEEESILEKMNDYLMTIPEWVKFVNISTANKNNN